MHPIELLDNKSEVLAYNVADMPIKLGKALGKESIIRASVNHWHNDFEFIYISEGKMSYCVNGIKIKLNAGEMIFVNSGRLHYNYWDEGENGDFICTIFHPSMLKSSIAEKYLNDIIGDDTPPYLVLRPEILREKKIINQVLVLHEAASRLNNGYEMKIMACIYEISLLLMEYMKISPNTVQKNGKRLEAMHRMVGFLQQKYMEKISLEEIAAAGFVSRSACCEIFKKYSDQTPIEYLTEYRISRSMDLLMSGDLSMTEIASMCGFGGSSYFTETFRKKMGCTPSEFRSRNQQ